MPLASPDKVVLSVMPVGASSRLERGLAPGLRLERLAAIMAVLGVTELRAKMPPPDTRR
jgi:hypothetical protein